MRINKFLAGCEIGSRRKVEEYITNGLITINGKVETNLSTDIKDNDVVCFKGKKVNLQTNKVYIMLNKPKCYITSLNDEKDRRIVTDLLKGCKEKVFPVGRLDFNTEGLLLLTNDGEWANNIIHPSKHIAKTYEVKLKHLPTQKQIRELERGVVIDGVKTLPAKVEIIGKDDDYIILNITIFEGRNREIRKMFEYLHLKIYNLKRISVGNLYLDDLEKGKYRYLTKDEIQSVFL